MIKVTGVRFRQAGKVYYFDPKNLKLEAATLSWRLPVVSNMVP